LDGWIKKGWRTAGGGAVKNQDLWEWLHDVAKTRDIAWHHVRASDMNLQDASMTASRKIRF
jgi:ribonuclease HI